MPVYEFVCDKCGRFETSRRWDEVDQVRCPSCRGKVRRVYSPTAFTFGFRLSDESHLPGHKDELIRDI
jgi:putative FmdB family regulatory protein